MWEEKGHAVHSVGSTMFGRDDAFDLGVGVANYFDLVRLASLGRATRPQISSYGGALS